MLDVLPQYTNKITNGFTQGHFASHSILESSTQVEKDDRAALLKQDFNCASPWNSSTHYEMQVLAF